MNTLVRDVGMCDINIETDENGHIVETDTMIVTFDQSSSKLTDTYKMGKKGMRNHTLTNNIPSTKSNYSLLLAISHTGVVLWSLNLINTESINNSNFMLSLLETLHSNYPKQKIIV